MSTDPNTQERWTVPSNCPDAALITYGGDETHVSLTLKRKWYSEVHGNADAAAEKLFLKYFEPLAEACPELQAFREAYSRVDAMRRELRETELKVEQSCLSREKALNDPKLAGKDLAKRLSKLEADAENARGELADAQAGAQAFEAHVAQLRQQALVALEQKGGTAMGKASDEAQVMQSLLREKLAKQIADPLDRLLHWLYIRRELGLGREGWARSYIDRAAPTAAEAEGEPPRDMMQLQPEHYGSEPPESVEPDPEDFDPNRDQQAAEQFVVANRLDPANPEHWQAAVNYAMEQRQGPVRYDC